MNTEAIVNTAGETPEIGTGCELAIYKAAGYDELHKIREEKGFIEEGEVFITSGLNLKAKFIIHAVSPYYIDGSFGEVEKLRSCYRKSLNIAKENDVKSIAFPLISTGNYGFPKAYGLRIAMDEINSFLLSNEMDIYIVVFDTVSTELAEKLHPQIEAFIDHDYVCKKREEEYGDPHFGSVSPKDELYDAYVGRARALDDRLMAASAPVIEKIDWDDEEFDSENLLDERIGHLKDPFGVYLLYLSERKKISLTILESTAWVSKHVVFKVRKNPDTYKPDKRTAFQFCVGLELGLDDTKDLLSRAGYTISESILEDKIWEFYIENEHFDIMDISDSLEKYGLKPIIDF